MTRLSPTAAPLSRRALLRAAGVAGATAGAVPLLGSCTAPSLSSIGAGAASSSGSSTEGSAADDVTGAFDWRAREGDRLAVLMTPHPYQQAYAPMLADFTALTGIEVAVELVPEADYFTRLNTELASEAGDVDVFMTGLYFVWSYGPPGWLEDLAPWVANESATDAEYDVDDLYEGLRASARWDLQLGSPVGTGGQWAMPWGFETTLVAYDQRRFSERGVRPGETLDELVDVAAALTDRAADRYGIAVRGSASWATIHAGFMTQFAREGAQDYVVDGDGLRAAMNSPEAVGFTDAWVRMVADSGPPDWFSYDHPDCARDLSTGRAAMVYDADSVTLPLRAAGAADLAWHPGPAGPDGSRATNLWSWALAMSAASRRKHAAWLFIQWATGREALTRAVAGGTFVNPARASVAEGPFREVVGSAPGYLDAFDRVIDSVAVQFTPQAAFFETTEAWAVALQDVYEGQDPQSRLDALAEASTQAVAETADSA